MSRMMLPVKSAFVLPFALLTALTGCQSLGGSNESIPADAMTRPVDLSVVCVLDNPQVKSSQLVKAVDDGIRSAGSEVRHIAPGEGPQACSFVMTYSVETTGKAVTAVIFQTFENSIPRIEARGEAGGGRAVTYDNAAAYAAELMRRTKKRLGIRTAAEPSAAPRQ